MLVPTDFCCCCATTTGATTGGCATPEERKRLAAAGIYDTSITVGGPASYKWINCTAAAECPGSDHRRVK